MKIRAPHRHAGFMLPETLIAVGITGLVILVVTSFMMFSGRSFAALFNYVDLDDVNRIAIDQITRDVRQANRVTSYTTNRLALEDSDLSAIVYTYSPSSRTLTRTQHGSTRVILHDCDSLGFSIGQRNTVGGSYDVYPAATADTAKVVNVSWVCSRTIFGRRENSESVQTARIVIRKQGS
jgi:Tfp pilus assembly protein PilW